LKSEPLRHEDGARHARPRKENEVMIGGTETKVLSHWAFWAGIPVVALLLAIAPRSAVAQEFENLDRGTAEKVLPKKPYSPYAGRTYPTRVFWGDTHLHTSQSVDSVLFGNTLGPEDAYRFARGEEITSSTGQRVQLSRPLDFLVVADHAENYGSMSAVLAGDPTLVSDPVVKRWHNLLLQGPEGGLKVYGELMVDYIGKGRPLPGVLNVPKTYRSLWLKNTALAEKYNDPGRFTALIGYEWSSNTSGNNLHRVVIFRDNADKTNQVVPFSAFDSDNPENLWKALDAYEQKTGGSVLAIPHNGNLSNGRMFEIVDFAGNPLTRQYAETRSKWEPVVEVTQMKGDGETHPYLSPNDEFSRFERWDRGNLDLSTDKKPEMLQYEYARSALKLGLKLEKEIGVNPYKFGMIGSTDAHTSLATADSDNYFGKLPAYEPSRDRWNHASAFPNGKAYIGWEFVAAGYAGVWAADNTREAIWDAIKRKEVYATTGPRMLVRFFGGWDFDAKDAQTRYPAGIGYEKGVPMGGDLQQAPAGMSPTFLVAALKDPIGGNLDRIQIVKGWLNSSNNVQEKIYDVVWSGRNNRKPGVDGKLPPVGDTVDLKTATWTNTIGGSGLITVWKDPEFDASLKAFYYARVLEIPTPRWTLYDAVKFDVKMDPNVPMVEQQRAYTSPIWYTPAK
jgi:hypothetical protein